MAAYPFIKVSMANGAERFINLDNIVSADAFRDGTIQIHMSDGNGFTLEGIDARVVHKQLQIRISIQIPEQP